MRDDPLKDRMKRRDDAQAEWEADQLVALMGKYLGRRRGNSPFDDPRYLSWLARELRRRPPSVEDWSAQTIRGMRDRILERGAALRLSVVAYEGVCAERPAEVKVSIGDAIDLAASQHCIPVIAESVAAGAGRELWDEECERWMERPRELPPGRYLALPVSGDSMTPLMHAGDLVVVKLGPKVVRDTVIVARQADDGYVVKRVGEMRADAIQLTSLNPRYAPIWISRVKNAVLGTVVWRACAHSQRAPSTLQGDRP
jgi:SOS-response transcriptional repressor LexA